MVLLKIHTERLRSFPSNSTPLFPKEGGFCSCPPPHLAFSSPLIWLPISLEHLTPDSSGTDVFIICLFPVERKLCKLRDGPVLWNLGSQNSSRNTGRYLNSHLWNEGMNGSFTHIQSVTGSFLRLPVPAAPFTARRPLPPGSTPWFRPHLLPPRPLQTIAVVY